MIPGLKDAKISGDAKENLYINRPAKLIKMAALPIFREKLEYLGLIWGTIVIDGHRFHPLV